MFRTQARSKNQVSLIQRARASYQKELNLYASTDKLQKADEGNVAASKLAGSSGDPKIKAAEDARLRTIAAVAAGDRIPAIVAGGAGGP